MLLLSVCLGLPGCGGTPENSVAAPPENTPTAEELAAEADERAAEYAAEQKRMRERDRSR
ncbi:hypothetical protein [Allorhodopirellula solitaria]|uniref:hypothetical protein n=1 Tax=Allorhodopirellula solitaria TaxID=2527987 RepID=UPI001FE529C0|nr:hypothetical protein [Allorhodopirellula solitaria]